MEPTVVAILVTAVLIAGVAVFLITLDWLDSAADDEERTELDSGVR